MSNPELPDTYGGGYSVMATASKIRIRDMIVRLETYHNGDTCPVCGMTGHVELGDFSIRHADDCELAWALGVLRAGGTEK